MSDRHLNSKEFFRTLHHRKWVRGVIHTFMSIALPGVWLYAHFIEPYWAHVTRTKIPVRGLPKALEGLRIVQISDLHFGPTNDSTEFFKGCVKTINDLKPDVIALTGDFLQWDPQYAPALAHILSGLKARLGVFASLGNHDYGVCHPGEPASDPIDHRTLIEAFQKKGIRVLHNERVTLGEGVSAIDIVGLGDYWTPHFLPEKGFGETSEKRPTILFSHNPDSVHAVDKFDFDLMLAGHVHGGQISFPFIGPLVVPVKHRHLRRGLHRIGAHWLYTNRGLGFTFQARLLSRPEIAFLELAADG